MRKRTRSAVIIYNGKCWAAYHIFTAESGCKTFSKGRLASTKSAKIADEHSRLDGCCHPLAQFNGFFTISGNKNSHENGLLLPKNETF
ncbi:hypothetical protein EVA_08665 [gut metagenome]|uniref:Uncharacterized protein n=1 Tax=gut metagenome TaxID=749906 RepID=J9G8P0_9ZZZZ